MACPRSSAAVHGWSIEEVRSVVVWQALGADDATRPRDCRLDNVMLVFADEDAPLVLDGELTDARPDLGWKVEERFWAFLCSCVSDCSSGTLRVVRRLTAVDRFTSIFRAVGCALDSQWKVIIGNARVG